jgi:hypothetical protein
MQKSLIGQASQFRSSFLPKQGCLRTDFSYLWLLAEKSTGCWNGMLKRAGCCIGLVWNFENKGIKLKQSWKVE